MTAEIPAEGGAEVRGIGTGGSTGGGGGGGGDCCCCGGGGGGGDCCCCGGGCIACMGGHAWVALRPGWPAVGAGAAGREDAGIFSTGTLYASAKGRAGR